jgi:TonB family protein
VMSTSPTQTPRDPASGGKSRSFPFAEERARERQLRREHIHAVVVHPIDTPQLLRDPLARHTSPLHSIIALSRVILVAIFLHALALLFFTVLGQVLATKKPEQANKRVQFNIVETPPQKLTPAPVAAPPPEGNLADDFETPPPAEKVEPLDSKPSPKLESPTEQASEEPKPESEVASPEPPRRIVGISFESTVKDGSGPRLAVGTTRMGQTDGTAHDPRSQPERGGAGNGSGTGAPGAAVVPLAHREQRAATRIPTSTSVFVKPRRTSPSEPPYPPSLKARGVEGVVTVRVKIGADGQVEDVGVVRGSGYPEFDSAAVAAARAERFSPATEDDKPVAFTLSYSYRFRIESK